MKRNLIILAIKLYSLFISPMLPRTCRYWPTCSAYAIEAVKKLGIIRGLWLSLRRIFRCNPFFAGGYDPVPKEPHSRNAGSALIPQNNRTMSFSRKLKSREIIQRIKI